MADTDKPEIELKTSAAKDIDPNGLDGTALGDQQDMAEEFKQSAHDEIAAQMAEEQKEAEQGEKEHAEHNYDPPENVQDEQVNEDIESQLAEEYKQADETGNNHENSVDYGNDM